MKLVIAVLVLICLSGCGSTEATRRSLHYDGEALVAVDAKLAEIESDPSATPVIVSTAKAARVEVANVRASIPLLKSEIGEPDPATTPPYTPEEHAKSNAAAKKELEDKAGLIDGVFNFLETGAGKLSAALGLGTIGALIIGWGKTALWSGKLWTYAKTAGSVIEKYKGMRAEVAEKAAARGVSKDVFKVVEALPVATPPPVVAALAPKPEEVIVTGTETKPPA